jgi:phage gp36-like protein
MAYSADTDLYDQFGLSNVTKWADLDNDGSAEKIAARIARAIAWADAEIDSRLRGGPYVLPLADEEEDVPLEIVDASACLAGVWLYESRGVTDYDETSGQPIHRLAYQRKRVDRVLREIIAGVRTLTAARTTTDSDIPKAIGSE